MAIQYAIHPVVSIGDCLNGQRCVGYYENEYIFQCTECCHLDRYSEFSIRNGTLQCKKCGLLAPDLVINVWRLVRPEWGSRTAWTCECVNCGCLRVMDIGEHVDCSCDYGVRYKIDGEKFKSLRLLHSVYGCISVDLARRKHARARPLAVCLGLEQEAATILYKGIPYLNPEALLDDMGTPISLSTLRSRIKSCPEEEWFLPAVVNSMENQTERVPEIDYRGKNGSSTCATLCYNDSPEAIGSHFVSTAIYNGKELVKKDILSEFNITARFYNENCMGFETMQHAVDWLDYRRQCIEKAGLPVSVFSRYHRAGVDISFLLEELSGTFIVNGVLHKTGYAALRNHNSLKPAWLKKMRVGYTVYDLILENNIVSVPMLEFDIKYKELSVDGVYIYPCLVENGDVDYLTAEEMLNRKEVVL